MGDIKLFQILEKGPSLWQDDPLRTWYVSLYVASFPNFSWNKYHTDET